VSGREPRPGPGVGPGLEPALGSDRGPGLGPDPGRFDDLLEGLRPRAFAIAYRLLGSVSEAEDVVQEALLRLHGVLAAGEEVRVPEAYLATVVTRLGINRLRSAQVRRETYFGEWLPEPVVTGGPDDPAVHAEMSDSLSLAFLVLLERLTPEQRAVFLLREVFDYDYEAIAEIVGKSEAACRQLAVRARRQVDEDRPRFETSRRDQDELARRFLTAAETGDLHGLEALLAADVALHGDGGGKVRALAHPVFGRRRVARQVLTFMRVLASIDGATIRPVEVNGRPGALGLDARQRVLYALSLDIADGRIQGIRGIVNPDKLRHLGPVSDLMPAPPQSG
jgi:RNA polymerase sigma-70 factor (ECF subfamily)